jgi:nitrous oxidase accessory protein NosD
MRNIRIAQRTEPPRKPVRVRTRWDRVGDWLATIPVVALPIVLVWAFSGAFAAGARLHVSPSQAVPGAAVTVQGTGLDPGERGVLAWDGTLLDSVPYHATGGDGSFTVVLVVPATATVGAHQIAAVSVPRGRSPQDQLGQASGAVVRASTQLTVIVAEESPSATALPSQPPALPEPGTPSPTPSPGTSGPPDAPTPAPSATASVAPTGPISPTPTDAAVPTSPPSTTCPASLQRLVDAAAPGATVNVPDCVYRETVHISKPLLLTTSGATVDGGGVRQYAFVVGANDVTLDGFEITATTNPAQDGAVRVRNSVRFTLRNSYIHHTGGACVSIVGGAGHAIIDSELAYCAQEGFHLPGITDSLIARNAIHHNNPNNEYSAGWEAGAGKLSAQAARVTFEANDVHANNGFGLWADGDTREIVFRANRIHHNTRSGIHFEISDGALIEGNAVWNNGWGFTTWGWGAGILVSTSRNVEVRNNVVAWNADGIAVISQNRTFRTIPWSATNVYVHDNDVIRQDQSDGSMLVLLGWQEDYHGMLLDPTSNNRGAANRYWYKPEPSARFDWNGLISTLSAFNATPGEEGGRYLTDAEKAAALQAAGVPASP